MFIGLTHWNELNSGALIYVDLVFVCLPDVYSMSTPSSVRINKTPEQMRDVMNPECTHAVRQPEILYFTFMVRQRVSRPCRIAQMLSSTRENDQVCGRCVSCN